MTTGRAIVFGEALIDVYPGQRVPAGAPLHVAIHLAVRGWDTALVTRVGGDRDGAALIELLGGYGVDTSLVEVDPTLPTGVVTIGLDGAEHSFEVHGPAAWDAIAGPRDLPSHDVFYFGTLAGRAASRTALRRALEASRAGVRVLDVNLRPPDVSAEVLRLGLAHATLVKAGDDELLEVARLAGLRPEPGAFFAAWPQLQWVCVTAGSSGAALWARSGGRWSVAAPKIEVVDTVGAGDVFTAGLVDALGRGVDEAGALDAARRAAASVLVRRGALPPRPPEA